MKEDDAMIRRSYRHGFQKYRMQPTQYRRALCWTIQLIGIAALIGLLLTQTFSPQQENFLPVFLGAFRRLCCIAFFVVLPATYYFLILENMRLTRCDRHRELHGVTLGDEMCMFAAVLNLFALGFPGKMHFPPLLRVPASLILFLAAALLLNSLLEHFADEQDLQEYTEAVNLALGTKYQIDCFESFEDGAKMLTERVNAARQWDPELQILYPQDQPVQSQ